MTTAPAAWIPVATAARRAGITTRACWRLLARGCWDSKRAGNRRVIRGGVWMMRVGVWKS